MNDLRSPKQIIEMYPEVQQLGWTYRTLGVLLSCGLVEGVKGEYGNSSFFVDFLTKSGGLYYFCRSDFYQK